MNKMAKLKILKDFVKHKSIESIQVMINLSASRISLRKDTVVQEKINYKIPIYNDIVRITDHEKKSKALFNLFIYSALLQCC